MALLPTYFVFLNGRYADLHDNADVRNMHIGFLGKTTRFVKNSVNFCYLLERTENRPVGYAQAHRTKTDPIHLFGDV